MPPYYYSEEDSSLILKCVCVRERACMCAQFLKREKLDKLFSNILAMPRICISGIM